MRLQRLTGLEIEKLAEEYAELIEEIEGYEAILADERGPARHHPRGPPRDEGEVRRHSAGPRSSATAEDFDIEDLIAEEDMVVTISHEGYIKRMPLDTYRRQGRGGKGIIGSDTKEGDFIEHLFVASTHDYLLFFTNRGRCYWQKVYDIPPCRASPRAEPSSTC